MIVYLVAGALLAAENPCTCPQDCGSECGDGWCCDGEDPCSCPVDCGTCGLMGTLAGAGDIANSNGIAEDTAVLLDGVCAGRGDECVVATFGDNAYPDGRCRDFERYYEPTWGRHKTRTCPTPGNHDYATRDASGYFDYFYTMPRCVDPTAPSSCGASSGAIGAVAEGWYAYDLGGWRIYALNSNCGEVDCGEQEAWLRQDLAAAPGCVAAYWHHARWTDEELHDDDDRTGALVRALVEHGGDLLLVGHSHNYQRFGGRDALGAPDPVDGIVQVVAGTGGTWLRDFGPLDPDTQSAHVAHGVVVCDLWPTGYECEFVTIDGSVLDAFSGGC